MFKYNLLQSVQTPFIDITGTIYGRTEYAADNDNNPRLNQYYVVFDKDMDSYRQAWFTENELTPR